MAMVTPIRVLSDSGPVRVELARWNDQKGQLVVVKRLHRFSPFLATRLKREAEVVEKLEHDNIVPLLITTPEMLIYAYCPGVSLAEALQDGSIPLEQSLEIIRDVLSALAYAHSRNIIHLDVKPGNILIQGDKALLTDFGFAKDLAQVSITNDDVMLGTPNYMAPEQFRGQREDPRSDLYATGAVLFHMLTGEPPYGGKVINFLVGDDSLELAPLPAKAKAFEHFLHKALARDPDTRFQSAEEMSRCIDEMMVAG